MGTFDNSFLCVTYTGSNSKNYGLNTNPTSMTAATPVTSRKTCPSLDFNASPLSDRTRRTFPSEPYPQSAQISSKNEEDSQSSSPSPVVPIRTGVSRKESSTSSPVISISTDDLKEDQISVNYLSLKNFPHELETHCNIYLEEKLYDKAIILLNNILVAGVSHPSSRKIWLPPKNQIAFISTLVVHPTFTTRATLRERSEVSSQALVLLRNILSIIGSSRAKLSDCFAFRTNLTSRWNRRLEREALSATQRVPYGEEPINSKLANEDSLWLRAQDFWQVVGWAFNCSILHRNRWNVWKIWLDYMLDVLEADWKENPGMNHNAHVEGKGANWKPGDGLYQNCILTQYVSEGARSSTSLRRIVKSIFADGSEDSLKAYPEIFKDETREANTKNGKKRKRELKLNLDEDEYGDYLQNEDKEGTPAPSQSDISSPDAREDFLSTPSVISMTEDPEAVALRLRLLALLSLASFTAPNLLVPIEELYKFYVDTIKPLPLQSFALFVSPSAMPHLPLVALSSIVQAHLSRLLPGGAPRPDDDALTQMRLERSFLPFAANTSSVEDNAKVSLLVETLFRLLASYGGIDYTTELTAAVERGIKVREKKCLGARKKKSGSAKDDEDMIWLSASAERMRLLLEHCKTTI